jgi:hypothetical protein
MPSVVVLSTSAKAQRGESSSIAIKAMINAAPLSS